MKLEIEIDEEEYLFIQDKWPPPNIGLQKILTKIIIDYEAKMPSAIDNCIKELNSVILFSAVERENCKYIIKKHFPKTERGE